MKQHARGGALMVAGMSATALLAALMFVGHDLADSHVRHIMGGPPAPLNCFSCHAYMNGDGVIKRVLEEDYLSPRDLAVSPDGERLYVVAEDGGLLLIVDAASRRVTGRIDIGSKPHSIVLNAAGTTAYVSRSWSRSIVEVDLATETIARTLPAGDGPAGLALGPEGRYLYAANMFSDDVSVVDLQAGAELRRLPAGNNPYAVRLSPDGRRIYVTNRLSNPVHFRAPPEGEVTVIDAATQRLAERLPLRDAHLAEGLAFAPGTNLALVTLVRPKQLIPSTQVGRGWMLTYGLGVITPEDGRIVQLLLDDVNEYFADPYDVVITPDGRRAFVTHGAANAVSVIDLAVLRSVATGADPERLANHLGMSSEYVVKRIPIGWNPRRMAFSPDGRLLYVTERLDDRIAVIDTERLETIDTIDLGGPRRISTLRLGERMFYASRAFQGQFSCRSCHPDNDQDALSWDFGGDGLGRNIVNSMTLRDIGQTAPFKWAGTNVSLYMQDGIRFAKHLTRVDPFPPKELNALVAYIYSIPQPPNIYRRPDGLTPAQYEGKLLFERTVTNDGERISIRDRCISCHPPPYFTNNDKADVGTRRDTDTPGMLFDVPQLINIYDTAPYLHDGSAPTLEEIWTMNSVNDEHGVVSDLTKNQLNQLIEYLRTL